MSTRTFDKPEQNFDASRRFFLMASAAAGGGLLLSACATPDPTDGASTVAAAPAKQVPARGADDVSKSGRVPILAKEAAEDGLNVLAAPHLPDYASAALPDSAGGADGGVVGHVA